MRLNAMERKVLTRVYAAQYRKASRGERIGILAHFCEVTGYNRTYAARLLKSFREAIPKKRQRARYYGNDVQESLERIWKIMDFMCGKRLAAALPETLRKLEEFKELMLERSVRSKLLGISSATIDRLLASARQKRGRVARKSKLEGFVVDQIPIKTFGEWKNALPGFTEMDLVAHNGGNVHGGHFWTLNATDVCTGWTVSTLVKNKAEFEMMKGLFRLKRALPFPLRGLDTDNGSEFINETVLKFCRKFGVEFTRGRPYKKNDGCFIEQKNHAVIRRNVGYWRYTEKHQADALRDLYTCLNLFTNYFQPSMALTTKRREGARVFKTYDHPKTPYARLLDRDDIAADEKKRLRRIYRDLNPASIRREIDRLQRELILAGPGPSPRSRATGIRRSKRVLHTQPRWRRGGKPQTPNPFIEKIQMETLRSVIDQIRPLGPA